MIKQFTKVILLVFIINVCLSGFSYAEEAFDYSIYETLLSKHVENGRVDYVTWKKEDLNLFEKYLESLDKADITQMSLNEQKAFWINAYNAVTIYAVLKRIPGIKLIAVFFTVQMVPGFFDGIVYPIAGEELTLNDIENNKLRGDFFDPRNHFAIVNASRSCPVMQKEIYRGATLDDKLDEVTEEFIQNKKLNSLNQKKKILYLSKIFDWYQDDFIYESGSVPDYVMNYMEKEDSDFLSVNYVEEKYMVYNWMLNIR